MKDHVLITFQVTHSRFTPKKYIFTHSFFWFRLNLFKLNSLSNFLVKLNKFGLYSFFDRDHSQIKGKSLLDSFVDIARSNGVQTRITDAVIYTNLRFLGYVFNPVSFIFLKDERENRYGIIEIQNTFGEIKTYFVEKDRFLNDEVLFKTKKFFYISPFIDHDNELTFKIKESEDLLNILVIDKKQDETILKVNLTGLKQELTNKNLLLNTLRIPFVTLKAIFLIHYHAFRLWWMNIPYYRKTEHQNLQREARPWRTPIN